jgi:TonB family protein
VQRSHVEVASAGFGDTVVAAPTPAISQPAALPVLKPVEIVSKPRPAYTDEARHLQIEGEVLVEVVFSASGEARVVRVLRGLGHGLDESAIAAARDIRFHPAQRGGAAVDSSAVVHIVFQLAY